MILIFLKALLIGFSIAMPVGAIGILCIKNSLMYGFKIGFGVGIGAAFADLFYGFLTGGGLAIISKFLLNYSFFIKAGGGLILIFLGISEIKNAKKIPQINDKTKSKNFTKTITTTFLLTLGNPTTILSFIGVFAAIGGNNLNSNGIILMIFGVFCGSLLWWIILALIISAIRHKISNHWLIAIKIISGIILTNFGLWSILN